VPNRQELNDIRNQSDVASLAVRRCPDNSTRVTQAHAYDRLLKIDVTPSKGE
jgi:hypothetical protein